MKLKTIYREVWISLFSAIAMILVFAYGFLFGIEQFDKIILLSFILSIISLTTGFRSLRVIHKQSKCFKGEIIIIPIIILSSLVFLFILLIYVIIIFIPPFLS